MKPNIEPGIVAIIRGAFGQFRDTGCTVENLGPPDENGISRADVIDSDGIRRRVDVRRLMTKEKSQ